MPPAALELRALYRRFLRELPARHPSILANPCPVQRHIRLDFETPSYAQSGTEHPSGNTITSLHHQAQLPSETRIATAEQYLQYIRSQRVYATLLERYNPGMNMDEEERLRLTARRVGMEMPVEVGKSDKNE